MKKVLSVFTAVILICTLFSACTDPYSMFDNPVNIAVVTAIANNNPILTTDIYEISQLPFEVGSTYSFILADSTPHVITSGTIPDFSDRSFTGEIFKEIELSIGADIETKVISGAPDSPEVDVASAISLAVRTLRDTAVEGRKNLLVLYLSGISTSGIINMISTPAFRLDVDTSVKAVAEAMDVDLSGIDVVFYCLGDVTEPQPTLSEHERTVLKDFYRKLFETLGAESIEFMDKIPPSGSYNFESQPVSIMPTEETVSNLVETVVFEELIENDSPEKAVEDVFETGSIISFDETSVAFLPDSYELADTNKALLSISYIVDYMNNHPDFELLICGTTASVGEEGSAKSFSEKRAASIRELLLSSGISAERLHIIGCGYSSYLYQQDRLVDGRLDEPNARLNRSVKMVDYNSETAERIIKSVS